jgi:hypothetical protein
MTPLAIALTIGGVLLQVVGALVVLQGLVKTHDAYAERSVRIIVIQAIDRRTAGLRGWINRRLGRHRVVERTSADRVPVGNSFGVAWSIKWAPLDEGLSTPAAIKELDRRIRQLSDQVVVLDTAVSASSDQARNALERLRTDLEAAHSEAVQLVRHTALEGLVREAIGLALVTAGAAIQAWGSLLPPPTP